MAGLALYSSKEGKNELWYLLVSIVIKNEIKYRVQTFIVHLFILLLNVYWTFILNEQEGLFYKYGSCFYLFIYLFDHGILAY